MSRVVSNAISFKILAPGFHTFTPSDGHFVDGILECFCRGSSEQSSDGLLEFFHGLVAGPPHLALQKRESLKVTRGQIGGVGWMTE